MITTVNLNTDQTIFPLAQIYFFLNHVVQISWQVIIANRPSIGKTNNFRSCYTSDFINGTDIDDKALISTTDLIIKKRNQKIASNTILLLHSSNHIRYITSQRVECSWTDMYREKNIWFKNHQMYHQPNSRMLLNWYGPRKIHMLWKLSNVSSTQ